MAVNDEVIEEVFSFGEWVRLRRRALDLSQDELAQRVPDYAHHIQNRVEGWFNQPPEFLRRFIKPDQAAALPADGRPDGTNAAASATGPVPADTNQVFGVTGPASGSGSTNAFVWFGQPLDRRAFQSATGWLARVLPEVGNWFFGQVTRVASWFGVLAGLALVPVYLFYFLLEKQGIQSRWTEYLPVTKSEFRNELIFIIRSINDYLIVFFRSQLLVAICD